MTKPQCPINDHGTTTRRDVARRGGFTFIELCLGLVITTLVMGAVAAFLLAMSQSWRHSDQAERTSLRARQATVRLVKTIRDAKLIGAVNQGDIHSAPATPAAVLIWVQDTNADGAIQGAECAMIEHDQSHQILRYYPHGQGDATIVLPWSTFTSQAVIPNFRVGRESMPIARGVEAAHFAARNLSTAAQNPTLEYTLKIIAHGSNAGQVDQSGQSRLEYGTCTLRAPAKQPA